MKQIMTVLCTGILTYKLLYWTGQEQFKQSYVTKADRERITKLLNNKQFRKEFDIYQVNDVKYVKLKPQSCTVKGKK